jgi:hypothetical protein
LDTPTYPEIKIAFRADRGATKLNADRRRDGSQGDAGASDKGFQEHIAGTRQ